MNDDLRNLGRITCIKEEKNKQNYEKYLITCNVFMFYKNMLRRLRSSLEQAMQKLEYCVRDANEPKR